MLRYSRKGRASRPAFFAGLNDITMIVEDMNDEAFYTELFQRVFGEGVRIRKVVGMGGKDEVITRFQERLAQNKFGNEFYLVDGDLDGLLGKAAPDHPRFHRLGRYDIEACIIDEDGLCEVALEEKPTTTRAEHRSALGFRRWFGIVVDSSVHLAAWYATCENNGVLLGPRPNINRFVGSRSVVPDVATVQSYVADEVHKAIATCPEIASRLRQTRSRIGRRREQKALWVSGKHVLLPLAARLIKKCSGHVLSHESLRFRLARHCQLESLRDVRDKALLVLEEVNRPMVE